MTNKSLSPAAQAVLDAYDNSHFDDDIGDRVAIAAQAVLDAAWQLSIVNCKSIAAALRAVAEQLGEELEFYNARMIDVEDLLAIAAELENN